MRSKYLRNGAKTKMHIKCVEGGGGGRKRGRKVERAAGKAKKINLREPALRNITMGNEIKNYN